MARSGSSLRQHVIAASLVLMAVAPLATAAPGQLDTRFNPNPVGGPQGDWYWEGVQALAEQADGKILVGGGFTKIGPNQSPATGLARLHSGGALDAGFTGAALCCDSRYNSVDVFSVVPLPSGKILIGGAFTTVDTQPHGGVARLNADGTLDGTFLSAVNGQVNDIDLLPSGKMLVSGKFTCVGLSASCPASGLARTNIARLNADGTPDPTFDADMSASFKGVSSSVKTAGLQSDGSIVIGGEFETVDGLTRRGVARLGADGALDTSFDPDVTDPNQASTAGVYALHVQPNGKIVIGGGFTHVGGQPQKYYARLNPDGTRDATVPDLGLGPSNVNLGWVYALAAQADGRLLVAGDFRTFNGTGRVGLVRLESDAKTVDTVFPSTLEVGPNDNTIGLALLAQDDHVIVGGQFDKVDGRAWNNLARLSAQGTPGWPPTAVAAVGDDRQAIVSWTAPPGDVTSYEVTSTPAAGTCVTQAPATSCTVAGLSNGTQYTFTVSGVNTWGTGVASTPSNAVTPVAAPPSPSSAVETSAPSAGPPSEAPPAAIPRVRIPAGLARSGLPVSAAGVVRLPLACPSGLPAACEASGLLTVTLPGSVEAGRRHRERAARMRVLSRFRGVEVASGATRLHAVRLAPAPYAALRRAGVRRVPADLRVSTTVAADGSRSTTRQRVWLRILPLARVAVTG